MNSIDTAYCYGIVLDAECDVTNHSKLTYEQNHTNSFAFPDELMDIFGALLTGETNVSGGAAADHDA